MAFNAVSRTNDPKWKKSAGQPAFGEGFASFVNPTWGDAVAPSEGYAIPTESYAIASSESFGIGSLIRLNGSSEATELTLITQTVTGVALEAVVNGASQGLTSTRVLLALCKYTNTDSGKVSYTRFSVADKDGAAPLNAHIGTQVAVYETGGAWYIDVDDTSNHDVEIVAINSNRSEFIVQFLDAVIQ